MERLKRMSVFAKVVELGSFTAAARQLQMSVSSISQTVAKLEDELQVKLLNRSTRSLGLTEAGKSIIRAADACCSKCRMSMSSCTPLTIRPSVRCASAVLQLWHRMSGSHDRRNAERVPGLSINLVTGIPAPDLIADGLDVVIRVGALQDSSLFSRRLGSMPMVLCAAKSYQHAGCPEKPADLASHSWLEYSVRPDNEFEIIARKGFQPS
jgi:DNA-binding transcriptional LysR family regulator